MLRFTFNKLPVISLMRDLVYGLKRSVSGELAQPITPGLRKGVPGAAVNTRKH